MTRFFLFFFYLIFIHIHLQAQSPRPIFEAEESGPGISQTKSYLPLIKGKNIGVIANQTSIYHNTHLIDTLVSEGIIVKKFFLQNTVFEETLEKDYIFRMELMIKQA